MTPRELWILSCGPVFEGLSRDKKKVRKHISLCFIGTRAQVKAEWERLQRINEVRGIKIKKKGVPVFYRASKSTLRTLMVSP